MRCKQCNSSFKITSWIIQCGECKEQYCTKCMKRMNGICYCEKCIVLITRPPDINELMKLKSKDLQEYLNRHNVPTFGLVEKRELVDLLCTRAIPVKNTKISTVLNKVFTNFESVLSLPDRINGQNEDRPRSMFSSSSSGNLHSASTEFQAPGQASTLPRTTQSGAPLGENIATTSASAPEASPVVTRKIPKIEEIEYLDDLNALSAKELKILLTFNRIDYKGCVEKTELLEKATRLWLDKQKQKYEELPDKVDDLCKLCMDAPLDCVLLECGHIAACINCGKQLSECPICRQYVTRVVRTFKA